MYGFWRDWRAGLWRSERSFERSFVEAMPADVVYPWDAKSSARMCWAKWDAAKSWRVLKGIVGIT
jgi:hypothetical protein